MTSPPPAVSRGWRAATVTGHATGDGPVPLRPFTLGDVLDEPFTLLRSNARTLLLLAGAVLLPFEILVAALQRQAWGGLGLLDLLGDPVTSQLALQEGEAASALALVLRLASSFTLIAVLEGLLSRVAVSSMLGERLTPAQVVRSTWRRWPALVAVSVLAALAAFGVGLLGIALLAAPGPAALLGLPLLLAAVPAGVAAYVLLRLAPLAVVVEGQGPLAALRRSIALVRRRFWPVLGALLLAALVSWLVQSALSGIPSALAFAIGLDGGWVLLAAAAVVAGVVVTPYTALVAAMVYMDSRIRTEALDVEILADTAGGAVPGR